jgi:uncharacterized secreted protein with C-terminal beta-propeller domain
MAEEDGLRVQAAGEPASSPVPAPAGDFMAMEGDAGGGGSGGGSHSTTNEQVEGVNEGDVVKTDGKYLYALSHNMLRIIEANGANMNIVGRVALEDMWGAEFYLMGDKIAIIGQKHMSYDMPGLARDLMWHGGRSCTVLLVYDITDRTSPVETRRVEIDGFSVSTRVIGDVVYLVTNKYVWVPFEYADSELILPCVADTAAGGALEPLDLDRVFYLPGVEDSSYLIISAVNVNSGEAVETTAYLGAGNQIYMSRDNLYVTKTRWEETRSVVGADGPVVDTGRWSGRQFTDILRFAIDGTNIAYAGMGTVSGMPINQYSMDEYKGYFRIATTDWEVGTLVTVLGGDMKIAGQTGYMAPGEWMHSMRFMGDIGYVVTFEMVDPLFTIDLKDPYNPRVLGELKIPGFSQYLHPVGDGLLMGIGRDTQEMFVRDRDTGVETVVGFRDMGLKVSLFDVSDLYDPKEVSVLLLGEGWAEVAHNPRALMCDPGRGLYGFVMESWGNRHNVSALLIRVDGRTLSIGADLDVGNNVYSWNSRLCFIGDTLYLVHEQGIRAYDYNTFRLLETLTF